MPIVSEAARRGDGGSSGFGRRGGSPSVAPGSDSRAAVLQCDEMEESDGEVQSSYRGPFETMDALQEALPSNRKRVSKFYNGKSSSVANVADAAQPGQVAANPGNPSPKKRKGFLSFSFSWNKSRSKGSSSRRERDATTTSSRNRRKTPPSPAPDASSSQGNSRCADEDARRWLQRRSSTRAVVVCASPTAAAAAALRSSQLIAVQMQAVCLEDVAESTASLCPREKRRRSLQ